MITRTMVRTRVMQTLFAYYKSENNTPHTAHKELLNSFSNTYSLYFTLLDFVNELTAYAQQQIEEAMQRAKITHIDYVPNRRFVNNKFAEQIFINRPLRKYVAEQHISWELGANAVASVYKQLVESKAYQQYMESETSSYEQDKHIWKFIFSDLMPENEDVTSALEELEIQQDASNWTVDQDVMLTFVVKTLRFFNEDSDEKTELLNMFDHEEELQFAERLLSETIEHHDECAELIRTHLKNWDADRIAYMDRIILLQALTEIIYFPDIALQITLNEYIEMSKEYSGDRSYVFINGILNEIVLDLQKENKIFKQLRQITK